MVKDEHKGAGRLGISPQQSRCQARSSAKTEGGWIEWVYLFFFLSFTEVELIYKVLIISAVHVI